MANRSARVAASAHFRRTHRMIATTIPLSTSHGKAATIALTGAPLPVGSSFGR